MAKQANMKRIHDAGPRQHQSQPAKRIHKVTIKRMIDESPDTSRLGEYSSNQLSYLSIDRSHDLDCPEQEYNEHPEGYECNCSGGDRGRNEYRYFNPSFNYVDKNGQPQGMTEADVIKYTRQDYERMERLNAGGWCFVGVRADAEYSLEAGMHGERLMQRLHSGGCWGIESDSDKDHFKSIEDEELSGLEAQLHAIGFSKRAIAAAMRNVERAEE
jgi:hypothetical protein